VAALEETVATEFVGFDDDEATRKQIISFSFLSS
jgi:hypothetical protein